MQYDDRKIFFQTMNHQPHERFLYYCNFTKPMADKMIRELGLAPGTNLSEHFGMFRNIPFSAIDCYNNRPGWNPDFWQYYNGIHIKEGSSLDDNGVLHEPGSMYHFTHYVAPLRGDITLDYVKKFPFRTMVQDSTDELVTDIEATKSRGQVTHSFIGHIYENAWQIRGYEDFLTDMMLNTQISDTILDRITQRNREWAVALAAVGVDILLSADDVAGQQGMIFGADRWRKILKPRWKFVYDAAKSINPNIWIWYHSDGNITEIIEDLIEIGVDIINPLQPECMDIVTIIREYGSRIIIDGTIGTQSVMPFGTPTEVRDTVYRMKDLFGKHGGLILSPTHVLEPEVPVENVLSFIDACREE